MSGFLDWVFPKDATCFLCGREARTDARGLCGACLEQIVFMNDAPCPAALDGFAAGIRYDAVAASAARRLKYDDARYLAPFFAALITVPPDWEMDAVVPVPLHKKKLQKRGYNQSALIARELAGRLGIPLDERLLVRARETESQTRFDAAGRTRNMAGAFEARPAAAGRKILLVDDVRTTGATLNECAKALRRAGADRIYGVTALARELQI